jgi:FMN phosphatase YigB (HAD superfamily)
MKTILVDAVHCFIIKKEEDFVIFQEMHDLLESYQNKKIILTGANDEQMIKFGLDNAPYEVFTLKHNPEKTDSKYYEFFLEKFRLNQEDVIYFEHDLEAIKSAESVGIKSYFYDNDKKDLESLKIFLDENLPARNAFSIADAGGK